MTRRGMPAPGREPGGNLVYLAEADVFDDGDTKPVRI